MARPVIGSPSRPVLSTVAIIVAAAAAFGSAPLPAAVRIVVQIEWWPDEPAGAAPVIPQVSNLASGRLLKGKQVAGEWVFEALDPKGLLSLYRLDLQALPPSEYTSAPLVLPLSYPAAGKTIRLVTGPARLEYGAQAVRALKEAKGQVGEARRPVYLQRARAVALERMRRRNEDWSQLHDYDVQAVFYFLQAAVQLMEPKSPTQILAAEDVERARAWLSVAIGAKPKRVNEAVGLGNARKVVLLAGQLEGMLFTKLWGLLENRSTGCDRRHRLLLEYEKLLNEIPVGERQKQIVAHTNVPLAIVLSSQAECLVANYKARLVKRAAVSTQIAALVPKLREELQATRGDVKAKIESDLATLAEIRRSLR